MSGDRQPERPCETAATPGAAEGALPAIHVVPRTAVRRGHAPDEYEDAWDAAALKGRAAIADGASESGFAGIWARLLVQRFARADASPDRWEDWLPAAQVAWVKKISRRELPWYAEPKAAQGAFATFLGLTVAPDGDGARWRAVAVGDACLFQTRGGELVERFPMERSTDLGDSPQLIGSRTPADEVRRDRTVERLGRAEPGDRLWLMTDALARWFLERHEAQARPWESLEAVLAEPAERFAGWIDELRDARQLKNDDVTLLRVEPARAG